MMNEALRQYLSEAEPPVTETILRHVLREEIPEYFSGAAPQAGGRAPRARKRVAVVPFWDYNSHARHCPVDLA